MVLRVTRAPLVVSLVMAPVKTMLRMLMVKLRVINQMWCLVQNVAVQVLTHRANLRCRTRPVYLATIKILNVPIGMAARTIPMMLLAPHATHSTHHTTMCVTEKHSPKFASVATKSNVRIVKKYHTIR